MQAATSETSRIRRDRHTESWLVEEEQSEWQRLPRLASLIGSLTLEEKAGELDEYVINWIRNILVSKGYPVPVAGEFDWQPHSDRGSLAKRLAKWAKAVKKVEISNEVLAQIGQRASNHGVKVDTIYHAAIYPGPFDWGARRLMGRGPIHHRFGAPTDSCWWDDGDTYPGDKNIYSTDGHTQAEWFYMRGGYAILLYSDRFRLCSDIGRCWLFELEPDVYGLANGYLRQSGKTLLYARLLAHHFQVAYKEVRFNNNGNPNSHPGLRLGLYNGGAVVGPAEKIKGISKPAYGWDGEDFNVRTLPDCRVEVKRRQQLIEFGRRYPSKSETPARTAVSVGD